MTQIAPDDVSLLAELNHGRQPGAQLSLVAKHRAGDQLVQKFQLGNGLAIILWEDHTAPVFSYHTWVRVGSRHEKVGRTGIAHLFEHLMFKATKNLGDGEFDTIMESHGAQTNAATWVDWTYYREKLPAGHLELCCKLEADRLENMILDSQQLESERDVVKNERLMRVDNNPDGMLYETLYALAYETHSYRWPTIGWMEDIEAISLEDCLAFYTAYYAPNNASLVIVGDFDRREALSLVQRFYGHLPAQVIPGETIVVEAPQRSERRRELTVALAAPKAIYAYHAPAAGDPAYAALEILNEILAGGESSRLYQALVTDLELASDVHGWTAAWNQPGLYELSLTMRPGAELAEAEAALDQIIGEVRREPISERELQKAVNGIEAGFLRSAADTGARARGLGHAEATIGDFRWFWSHQEALKNVTTADIHAVARRVLDPTSRTVVIGAPEAESQA